MHPNRRTVMDVLAILVSLLTDPPPPVADRAVTAWEQLMLPPAQEDDPWWDCRVHGNRICGPAIAAARVADDMRAMTEHLLRNFAAAAESMSAHFPPLIDAMRGKQ